MTIVSPQEPTREQPIIELLNTYIDKLKDCLLNVELDEKPPELTREQTIHALTTAYLNYLADRLLYDLGLDEDEFEQVLTIHTNAITRRIHEGDDWNGQYHTETEMETLQQIGLEARLRADQAEAIEFLLTKGQGQRLDEYAERRSMARTLKKPLKVD